MCGDVNVVRKNFFGELCYCEFHNLFHLSFANIFPKSPRCLCCDLGPAWWSFVGLKWEPRLLKPLSHLSHLSYFIIKYLCLEDLVDF